MKPKNCTQECTQKIVHRNVSKKCTETIHPRNRVHNEPKIYFPFIGFLKTRVLIYWILTSFCFIVGDEPCTENGYGNLPGTYRGTIAKTKGGYNCQKWTSQSPNEHNRTPENFPGQGLGDHNYCRNPDGEVKAWFQK